MIDELDTFFINETQPLDAVLIQPTSTASLEHLFESAEAKKGQSPLDLDDSAWGFDEALDREAELSLFSSSLFSKFGFWDGDQLYGWTERHIKPGLTLDGADLLVAAVEAYLLPALKQSVTTQQFVTMHNPIRARAVDGVNIPEYIAALGFDADDDLDSDYLPEADNWLQPEYVTVTDEQLVALFPELLKVDESL